MGTSDTLYFIQVVIPLCGCFLVLTLAKVIDLKRTLIVSGAITFPSLLGLGLSKVAVEKHSTLQLFHPDMMHHSFSRFVHSMKHYLLGSPFHFALVMLFLGGCGLIVTREITLYMFHHKKSALCLRTTLFPLYFFLAFSLNVSVIIGSGMFVDDATFRYFLPFLIFPAFFGVPFVIKIPHSKIIKRTLLALIVPGMLIFATLLVLKSIDWHSVAKHFNTPYYPPLVECIDENTARIGVKYGVSHYWQARPISMLTRNDLKVVQVNADLSPWHIVNNLAWYEEMKPEFAIIDYRFPENHFFRLDEDLIISRFGEPDTVFWCDKSKVLVYNHSERFRELFHTLE